MKEPFISFVLWNPLDFNTALGTEAELSNFLWDS